MARKTGTYSSASVAGEKINAFIPHALPPKDPPFSLDADGKNLFQRAEQELGKLELAGAMIPSIRWFIYAFVRKEAIVSSQIEGTQATLIDLLTFEANSDESSTPNSDVEEVCNYLEALRYARNQLHRADGLPLSMRLLNDMHRRLMKGVRGANKEPGEVRRSQNWIGGTRPGNAVFVPPPPHVLPEVLSEFEKFIHTADGLPSLIKIGLLHVQFETIHPYLDGNGRVGRILITLLLESMKLLTHPLLYLSLYFKRNREDYYRLLNGVRVDGDWEAWMKFFLNGIATISHEATQTAQKVFAIVNSDRTKIQSMPRTTVVAIRLFELLPEHPIITIPALTNLLQTTKPTAAKAINTLVEARILTETSGRRRDRTFSYNKYLNILRTGTELD